LAVVIYLITMQELAMAARMLAVYIM